MYQPAEKVGFQYGLHSNIVYNLGKNKKQRIFWKTETHFLRT